MTERHQPRILLVSLSGIGNLLMATPLLRRLHERLPGCHLDVVVARRGTAALLEGHPRVRRTLLGTAKPSLAEFLRMVRAVHRGRYDLGFICHPGQRIMSAALLRAGGVARRLGHHYRFRGRSVGWFLTDPVSPLPHAIRPLTDHGAHDVVQNLRLLQPIFERRPDAVLVSAPFGEDGYDLPLRPEDHAAAEAWLTTHEVGEPRIGFHPGTHPDLAYKRWPAERWSELGDRLAEVYGASLLIVGGPEERTLKTEVAARMRALAFPVELPLRATAALLARCAFVVTNDSGLMHLAAAVGTLTFGLFGPTDERRTAPWGPRGIVLRAPGTVPTYDVAHYRALRALRAPDPSLLALTPDFVAQRITAAVPQPAGGAPPPRQ